MAKTLGSKPKKRKALKNPLPFESTVLHITPADIAEMALGPDDIKLAKKNHPNPFTPNKVFRGTKRGERYAYTLSGVTKTLPAAVKLAKREQAQGWDIGRAKTRDGYAVYISG